MSTVKIDDDTVADSSDMMDAESFVVVDGGVALSLSVLPKHDVIGVGSELSTTHLCASVKAKEIPDEDDGKRAPVDIVVALDASGSMKDRGKLSLCKRTLDLLLRVLSPRDRFGLITYASEATIDIPIQKMTEKNKEHALNKIKALQTHGCTNISAAIGLASQEMHSVEEPNEVRSIFLLTDGLANQGITDEGGMVELTKNCLKSSQPVNGPDNHHEKKPAAMEITPSSPPITMHTFGYGVDHNASLLRGIASATIGGSYYFVEKEDSSVGTAFGDALGGILSVVAQNAVVTIKVPPEASACGVEITKVHHEQAIKRENGSYTVTLGDFYAEEVRDVLFEVKLARPESPTTQPIIHAAVSLAYSDTIEKHPVEIGPVPCSVARPTGPEVSGADTHVSAQILRISTLREMEAAERCAAAGQWSEARARVGRAKQEYMTSPHAVRSHAEVASMAAQLDEIQRCYQPRQYGVAGSKTVATFSRAYQTQRAAATAPSGDDASSAGRGAASAYRTTHKARFSDKLTK